MCDAGVAVGGLAYVVAFVVRVVGGESWAAVVGEEDQFGKKQFPSDFHFISNNFSLIILGYAD